MNLSPALLEHFSRNYMEFIALTKHIERATAYAWCNQIWNYIYLTYYCKAKAA